MKKSIILLTLAFFILASQMWFVHALDMGTSHEHSSKNVVLDNDSTASDGLLCNISKTTNKKQHKNDWQECLNWLLNDFYIGNNSKSINEFKETIQIKPFHLVHTSPYKISDIQFLTSWNSPPYHIDQSLNWSSYQNLIWIIKNLN